jgi:hypothetical protein
MNIGKFVLIQNENHDSSAKLKVTKEENSWTKIKKKKCEGKRLHGMITNMKYNSSSKNLTGTFSTNTIFHTDRNYIDFKIIYSNSSGLDTLSDLEDAYPTSMTNIIQIRPGMSESITVQVQSGSSYLYVFVKDETDNYDMFKLNLT